MLVYTCFLTAFFASQNLLVSSIVGYQVGVWAMIVSVILFALLPLLVKKSLPTDVLAHLYVGMVYSLNIVLFYFGGGFSSVTAPYFTMVPLMAILLISRQAGLWWLIATCLALALLGAMQLMGHEYPSPFSNVIDAWFKISAYSGLMIIIFFCTKTFDEARERAMNAVENKNVELNNARKISDNLLLNILPQETATELKETGKATTKSFDNVTIMFADFIGFTQTAERLTANDLVELIDEYFSAFDDIMSKHNLEKIKTIGDAYMVAGGLPHEHDDHAENTILAAKDMCEFVVARQAQKDKEHFLIRIGIHSGPVIAGVVGSKKFSYDIWGDSVNVAARMEGSGASGKINISGATYALIKDLFDCTYRGKVKAKHKGQVDMYYVN